MIRPVLRHGRDLQALAYLAAQTLLMGWQWQQGFHPLAFVLTLFLAVGVSVIHHNHAHLPIWRSRLLNRSTDAWITLLQGHPTCVFHPAHNRNHHIHRHRAQDVMRTWRFGDHNTLVGWMLHPLQAACAVYPLVLRWLAGLARRAPGPFAWYALHYLTWLGSWAFLLCWDAPKALLLVIGPQLFGLHWLLASNYLQHAHASDTLPLGYARNFGGLVNPLLFNIGLHTAHHEHPRAHWSQLPALHAQLRARIDPRLLEAGLAGYVTRVFLLAPLLPRLRSRSLRAEPAQSSTLSEPPHANIF